MTTAPRPTSAAPRQSLRTEILEARPVNLDGFVEEWPEKGLVAMESDFDPVPSIRVEDGRIVELDGKARADFDFMDTFIADHAIDVASAEDLRIAPETLELQAQLADASNRPQLAMNFRRAAEMCAIPDAEVLGMYNALRPRASTAAQLTELADRLQDTWSAPVCAALVREAAEVYARRDLLARPVADSDQ